MSDDAFVTGTASAADGALAVRTTEQGLPLALSIEPHRLRGNPSELAAEILRLCRRSAGRAALDRRAQLEAAGVAGNLLTQMGLPTPDEVARQEQAEEEEYETEPQSWFRST